MMKTLSIPIWLVILLISLAAWTLLFNFVFPLFRLYFRKKEKEAIVKINDQLDLKLPHLKLTKRNVLIDRLINDPQVLETAEEYSREHEISQEETMSRIKHYAKEIVPAFNAYFYFRLCNFLSKRLGRMLYRIRIGYADEEGIAKVDPHSSVVFLMNHRSNMDYLLLGYLTINRVALSFACGEWARVWPLETIIRAMGAFFVRRGSRNKLYRQVLASYTRMATEGGVVQVVYPEGGLSRDGRMREPKIGLLDYMVRSFDPEGKRDLVFIPAAVNYDRVLEDRSHIQETDPYAEKKSPKKVLQITLSFIFRNIWQMLRGKWYRFGYAAVNFGTPISMREYTSKQNLDFRSLTKEERINEVKKLAKKLLGAIGKVIPVLPVSLIAYVFAENPDKDLSDFELKAKVQTLINDLEEKGAHVYIPRHDRDYALNVGLRMLTLRHLVVEENDLFRAASGEVKLLRYYANSISHLI